MSPRADSGPDRATLIPDAPPENWVDRFAPPRARPYLQLARADRPIGTWLLLLPGWWSIALAAERGAWPDPALIVWFAIGAWAMRAAGCTFNDIVDRDFDRAVERTRNRPIPSGQVSVAAAVAWLALLALVGLAVLMQLNALAIWLGVASLALVAIYPFMKRITWWPQFFLGLAFNWGAIMGWAAVRGELAAPAVMLYLAGIAWTLGYDTIYAHQDKEDDALIGVKSTARLFGAATLPWIVLFYSATIAGLGATGWLADLGPLYYLALTAGAAQLGWQIATLDIDDAADCLAKFHSNKRFGLILFAGVVAGQYF